MLYNKSTYKKNLIRLFAFLFTFFICSLAIAEKNAKAYPPYPDVWGYDISEYPAVKWGQSGKQAYRMEDGDIWFIIDYSYKIKDPLKFPYEYYDEEYILLKFFSGEQRKINAKERTELFALTKGKDVYSEIVSFSDGSTLQWKSGLAPRLCSTLDFVRGYFLKTDLAKNEIKYSILAARPQVDMISDQATCEEQAGHFLYQKIYPLYNLIDLGDDTFLAYTGGSNLILRFDRNINTQFKPVTPTIVRSYDFIRRNFFVVEYQLIEEIASKTIKRNVPYYQTIHDELLLYLQKKYK
jgi:hypothetical protein